ncbi:MAG: S46 family peptidase [Bacteroidota bacterium]
MRFSFWASLLFAMLMPAALSAQADVQPYSADTDGMWLPTRVKDLNYAEMKSLGCEVPVDSIYNEAAASLEDAIVSLDFGAGLCSGEIISPTGLMLTNHHCAYDGIASLSSTDNDLLTDGFWAQNHAAEKPLKGITASFLIRSVDVTEAVTADGGEDPFVAESRFDSLVQAAIAGTDYRGEVKEMLHGNEYWLFVYEDFTDVRLVGAPPSAIGKFGYDQDNWIWPRHTGDFALMRVYAGPDNKPAAYSTDNVPYKPRHFLPVSLEGIDNEDFTMIMGYPGSTDRYLTSSGTARTLEYSNPDKIRLLGLRTQIMKEAMDADDATRIALAAEYSSLMNQYKYYIGQTTMLERYDVIDEKKAEEEAFSKWVQQDSTRIERYAQPLTDLAEFEELYIAVDKFRNYLFHSALGTTSSIFAYQHLGEFAAAWSDGDSAAQEAAKAKLAEAAKDYFKQFVYEVDELSFANLALAWYSDLPEGWHPALLAEMAAEPEPVVVEAVEPEPLTKKEKRKLRRKNRKKNRETEVVEGPSIEPIEPEPLSDTDRILQWTQEAYAKSIVTDSARFYTFLDNPNPALIAEDPIYRYVMSALDFYFDKIIISHQAFEYHSGKAKRRYLEGLQKMKGQPLYPDANSTMRLSYGVALPYLPEDGVRYEYFTTLDGVMEKYDPEDKDYFVPEKLRKLATAEEYGPYVDADGELHTCFITTNDITGGSSGSGVMNAKGELIGVAFDGNWEAMAGDLYVFPQFNRTICVDIRYVLFVIDKFAGASHLLDEMKIVQAKASAETEAGRP